MPRSRCSAPRGAVGEPLACAMMDRGYPSGERCTAHLYAAASSGGAAKRPGLRGGRAAASESQPARGPSLHCLWTGGRSAARWRHQQKRQAGSPCDPPPRDYRQTPSVCRADLPRAAVARYRVTPFCAAGYVRPQQGGSMQPRLTAHRHGGEGVEDGRRRPRRLSRGQQSAIRRGTPRAGLPDSRGRGGTTPPARLAPPRRRQRHHRL